MFNKKYDVFISYSSDCEEIAFVIERALYKTITPWYRRKRRMRIYMSNADSYSATEDYLITDALFNSSIFYLIASPGAAASGGMNKQVEQWITNAQNPENLENFYILLARGMTGWDSVNNEFNQYYTNSLPEILLQYRFEREPVRWDLRGLTDAIEMYGESNIDLKGNVQMIALRVLIELKAGLEYKINIPKRWVVSAMLFSFGLVAIYFFVVQHYTVSYSIAAFTGAVACIYLVTSFFLKSRLAFIGSGESKNNTENNTDKLNTKNKEDNVWLGLTAPKVLVPKENYTIRFVAYGAQKKKVIREILEGLSPGHRNILDVEFCKWQRNTAFEVRLYGDNLNVKNPVEKFIWQPPYKIINFDVQVTENTPVNSYIDVKVDVLLNSIVIAKLRMSLNIAAFASTEIEIAESTPFEKGFASYAREDSARVKDRLSEIERNGMQIYFDRFSLETGKRWKEQLEKAIIECDTFLLFWSSNAMKSKNVKWEWKKALKYKGLNGIDPHPLEAPSIAPPPPELASLHFDNKFFY